MLGTELDIIDTLFESDGSIAYLSVVFKRKHNDLIVKDSALSPSETRDIADFLG